MAINTLLAASRGLLVDRSPATVATRGLLYTQANSSEIPSTNVGLSTRPIEFLASEGPLVNLLAASISIDPRVSSWSYTGNHIIDLEVSDILLAPQQILWNYSGNRWSDLPLSGNITVDPNDPTMLVGTGLFSTLPSRNIGINERSIEFSYTDLTISALPSAEIQLDTNFLEVLLGEMPLLSSVEIPIDSRGITAYTAPTGYDLWRERIRFSLLLKRRVQFYTKR